MGVSSTALLACGALLLLSAADIVDCAEDFLTKTTEAKSVGTRTLIYSGAFTKQLHLLGPDASVEQLALTEEDVQFFGVTVDECEFRRQRLEHAAAVPAPNDFYLLALVRCLRCALTHRAH